MWNAKRVSRVAGAAAAVVAAVGLLGVGTGRAMAQVTSHPPIIIDDGPIIIVPQVRPRHWHNPVVRLSAMNVSARIENQVATTTVEMTLHNPAGRQQEAQLVFPVPDGVAIRSMAYDGVGVEPSAKILPRDEARRIYDSIVNRQRDPALLEFAGYNLIRTSVFPVPPGGSQKVTLTYELLLPAEGDRVDYVLPRSESLEAAGVAWSISATIKGSRAIATVYSPSHDVGVERPSHREAIVRVSSASAGEPGSFRLSYLLVPEKSDGLTASVIAYPDSEGGGYLMVLAGAPEVPADRAPVKRELVMVIDRSGSMRGPKMEQTKAAALQVLEGLGEGEAFNIIDYSDSIASFADRPVIKTRETMAQARDYVKRMTAGGGTNINDALQEALRTKPTEGMLPIVLFMTDGLPTVGERSEVKIREAAKAANGAERRIFSFGVGFDVNAPLLTAIARSARGTSTFVLPDENVEVKVSGVYKKLNGPIIAGPRLTVIEGGEVSTRALRDVQPAVIPDVFEGDQIVLLARYQGERPLKLKLDGNYLGAARSFEFSFDPSTASNRHGYIPRLWATRKIATLIEEVRNMGASGPSASSDPRFKELTDEIVRLSTKFGVLTEYTAFLATEPGEVRPLASGGWARDESAGMPAKPMADAPLEARRELAAGASVRGGGGGVAQELNSKASFEGTRTMNVQSYMDKDMKKVNINGVQQVADRALFFRNNRWIDNTLISSESEAPEQTVEFGTPEFHVVLDQLVKEGRQGMLARGGDVYLRVQGKRVLVKCPS